MQIIMLAVWSVGMLLLAAQAAADDPVPHWPRAFSVEFNETTKLFLWTWQTTGSMFYDAEQDAELVHRANGRGDRYCGSIHPLTDTPCTHLVVGGMRYLIFPDLDECCSCCSVASGCGILDPNWLVGAEYVGQVTTQGRLANEWAIRGLQPNQYYASADDQEVPLELDQDPNDYITFHPDTYKPGRVSPGVFSLPAGVGACSKRCPLASVCTIAAVQGSLRSWFSAAPVTGRKALSWPVGHQVKDRRWRQQQQEQMVVA